MKPPTVRLREILNYVRFYWNAHGYAPSIRDIVKGCKLSSTSVASYNVQALERAGLLRQDKGKARSIREVARRKRDP